MADNQRLKRPVFIDNIFFTHLFKLVRDLSLTRSKWFSKQYMQLIQVISRYFVLQPLRPLGVKESFATSKPARIFQDTQTITDQVN